MFSEENWIVFERIKNFLEIFKEVTVIMSGSFYPTISMTIPLYNILIDHVEDIIGDEENEDNEEEWNQIIKNAAKRCKRKLLEYYNKTNDTYLISTILDPRLKIKYYKDHDWGNSLISTIHQK